MMKSLLLKLASNNPLFAGLKRIYQSVRDRYYRGLRVDDKLIVFEAFRSTKYADSPKAIYEYLLGAPEYNDYKFIWVFEQPEKYQHLVDKRTKVVKHESHAHYTAFARAKYWVINGWIPLRFEKKSGQVLLQCWHGTPLKRLRHDIPATIETDHRVNALRDNDLDAARFDYFISPSRFASQAFTSAFNLKALDKQGIIIETGYPRNDYLINHTAADVDRIKRDLKIPADKKILLYAPTWRDDQNVKGEGYKYNLPVDFDYLQEQLSADYVILFRAHNLVANSFGFSRYQGFIYDASDMDDINELYVISDVLMTDYSSVFFDFANLRRPIIFFMYDKDHYQNELRGFYVDLDELPGEIAIKEEQVVDALSDIKKYGKRYKEVYASFNHRFNYLDDGNSTERAVKKFLK